MRPKTKLDIIIYILHFLFDNCFYKQILRIKIHLSIYLQRFRSLGYALRVTQGKN